MVSRATPAPPSTSVAAVRSRSNIPELIAAWESSIKRTAVEVGLDSIEDAMMEVYETDGFGGWTLKSPEQMRRLQREGGVNAAKLMAGLTLSLKNSIQQFDPQAQGSGTGVDWEGGTGWGDEQHPDPGMMGDQRRSPRPSMAQVAAAHEFGVEKEGQVRGEGIRWWLGSTSGEGSPVRVPSRRWASLAADKRGRRITLFMREAAGALVEEFNSLPVPRTGV